MGGVKSSIPGDLLQLVSQCSLSISFSLDMSVFNGQEGKDNLIEVSVAID